MNFTALCFLDLHLPNGDGREQLLIALFAGRREIKYGNNQLVCNKNRIQEKLKKNKRLILAGFYFQLRNLASSFGRCSVDYNLAYC